MNILVVEDEARMAQLLRNALTEEGHQVVVATDGTFALGLATAAHFDIILLDLMLPGMDGFAVASGLREARNQTPLLVLTAKDADADVVRALDLGADDYLTKPFSFEVLLARIRAISRRAPIPQSVRMELADLSLNTSNREVVRGKRQISLTPREFSLLELLFRHKGRVVSRERILESVWGFHSDVEQNTLEAFIRLLRNKIEDPQGPKLIHTVRGVGYTLQERGQ